MEEKLNLILAILEFKKRKGLEGRKPKMKLLRKELLEKMEKDAEIVGNYVLVRAYTNSDKSRPYLQIFERKTFIALKEAFKKIKNKELLKKETQFDKRAGVGV